MKIYKKSLLAIAVLSIASVAMWNVQIGNNLSKYMSGITFTGIQAMATEGCNKFASANGTFTCFCGKKVDCKVCVDGSSDCTSDCNAKCLTACFPL